MRALWTKYSSDEVSGLTGFDDGSVARWSEGEVFTVVLPDGTTMEEDIDGGGERARLLADAELGQGGQMTADEEAEFERAYFGV